MTGARRRRVRLARRNHLRLAATLNTNALPRDAGRHVVLVEALADRVEVAALRRKEEVGAGVVGELEVELVVGDALPPEPDRGDAVLALAPG